MDIYIYIHTQLCVLGICILYAVYIINCTGNKDGDVTAVLLNPAISVELLEIKKWYAEGATIDDVIERLRLRTVPLGYSQLD